MSHLNFFVFVFYSLFQISFLRAKNISSVVYVCVCVCDLPSVFLKNVQCRAGVPSLLFHHCLGHYLCSPAWQKEEKSWKSAHSVLRPRLGSGAHHQDFHSVLFHSVPFRSVPFHSQNLVSQSQPAEWGTTKGRIQLGYRAQLCFGGARSLPQLC